MNQIDKRTPTELMEIDAEDDNTLRLIVVVPWELPGQWEQWQPLFASGPVPVTGGVGRTVFDGASRRLREPVRKRMLSASLRLRGALTRIRQREEPDQPRHRAFPGLRVGRSQSRDRERPLRLLRRLLRQPPSPGDGNEGAYRRAPGSA